MFLRSFPLGSRWGVARDPSPWALLLLLLPVPSPVALDAAPAKEEEPL